MSPIAGPFPPNNDLVGVAWLSQRVPGIVAGQVATTLPANAAAWTAEGFVQIQAIPGGRAPDIDVPLRLPVFQVDCWAVTADSAGVPTYKPHWAKANRLAELIRIATEDGQLYGKAVVMPAGYSGARVQAAYLLGEPGRVNDDPSGYARLTLDLALDWVRA